MNRVIQRQLALLSDEELDAFGLIRKGRVDRVLTECGSILKEGRVLIDCKREGHTFNTIDLGPNTLTHSFRIAVARILARPLNIVTAQTNLGSVTSVHNDGYDQTDSFYPSRLYIGTKALTPATATQTKLEHYLMVNDTQGSSPIHFNLSRIAVRSTYADYQAELKPIYVAFEFDIPDGTLRSGADAESVPYLIREFGLSDASGSGPPVTTPSPATDPQTVPGNGPVLLARKVADVIKLFEMSLTVRWEVRT